MDYRMLLGTSFCGSTLLSMMLGAHQEVTSFGDTYPNVGVDYSNVQCTCGAPVLKCPLRERLAEKMAERGYPGWTWSASQPYPGRNYWQHLGIDKRSIAFYRLIARQLRERIFRSFYCRTSAYLAAIADLTGASTYFDGCKSLVRLDLLTSVRNDIKVMHLIKDPRAYVYSAAIKRNISNSCWGAYRQWLSYNQLAYDFRRIVGADNYRIVYYGELVRNPEKVLGRILKYFGLGNSGAIQDVRDAELHIVGNPMRLNFEQIEDRSQEWRPHMRKKLAREIIRCARDKPWMGDHNARLSEHV